MLTGLALSHYQERRESGESIPAAIGTTIAAAFLAPFMAISLLIGYFRAKKEQ